MGLMCWSGEPTERQPTDVAQLSLRQSCTVYVVVEFRSAEIGVFWSMRRVFMTACGSQNFIGSSSWTRTATIEN